MWAEWQKEAGCILPTEPRFSLRGSMDLSFLSMNTEQNRQLADGRASRLFIFAGVFVAGSAVPFYRLPSSKKIYLLLTQPNQMCYFRHIPLTPFAFLVSLHIPPAASPSSRSSSCKQMGENVAETDTHHTLNEAFYFYFLEQAWHAQDAHPLTLPS